MRTESEMRALGLVRYYELSEKAKKEAYDRFAWDFVNNKWSDEPEDVILDRLSKHWFDKNGGTFLGFA